MAALAKKKTTHQGMAAAWRGQSAAVRAVREGDMPRESAVHRQQALLETVFAEAVVQPYPGPVKAAILIGVPAALWVGIFAVVAHLVHG